MSYICNSETVGKLKNYFNMLSSFLQTFKWLSDAYVLDFFTDEHWHKLPPSWQAIFCDMELKEIHRLMDPKNNTFSTVLPLTLTAFRSTAFALTWPRKAITPNQLRKCLEQLTGSQIKTNNIFQEWSEVSQEFGQTSCQHELLEHVFRRHVKPKKQHEIFRCAEVVDHVCQTCKCSHVLDVGSGQGHLSRVLGFKYGLKVISIEGNGCHLSGAKKFDTQVVEDIQKKKKFKGKLKELESLTANNLNIQDWHPPKQVNFFISPTCGTSEALKTIFPDSPGPPVTLLGLHACGNLSSTMLRLYVESPEVRALISVGCCYMKLDSDGFPLSKMDSHFTLSYEAKEVSCHALEQYQMRIKEELNSLKIHCFRATLEVLIRKYYPELKRLGLRSIKHSSSMTFEEYAKKALSKPNIKIPCEELKSETVLKCLDSWRLVVIFYSLRLMIAPVIESFITLDRMLYLFENGYPSSLIPVFDSSISPRNHFLISVKPGCNDYVSCT